MATDVHERTEQATPKRLEDARRKGQVIRSRDAVAAAGLLGGAAGLWLSAPSASRALHAASRGAFSHLDAEPGVVASSLAGAAMELWPALALPALAAAGVGLVVTGGALSARPLLPDPARLYGGAKLLFGKEGWTNLAATALKVAVVGAALAWGFQRAAPLLAGSASLPTGEFPRALAEALALAAGPALGAVAALASGDYLLQRRRFFAALRMTRQEVKEERKQEEGDPGLRARRRRFFRDLLQNRIRREVPRADVVVVNPTEYAVALRYRRAEGRAPRVVAKGRGRLAARIREIARAHGIAIVPDPPLARLVYAKVRAGREIPEALYHAVAEVLAAVYRAQQRSIA